MYENMYEEWFNFVEKAEEIIRINSNNGKALSWRLYKLGQTIETSPFRFKLFFIAKLVAFEVLYKNKLKSLIFVVIPTIVASVSLMHYIYTFLKYLWTLL